MTKSEPIIAVADIEKSSAWYQKLLNCKSAHGGADFEILTNEKGIQILSLHKWDIHGHPTLSDSSIKPGNGLIIYFVVDDLNRIWENAKSLNATIDEEIHLNKNSKRMEFSVRDLDGYYISVCEDYLE